MGATFLRFDKGFNSSSVSDGAGAGASSSDSVAAEASPSSSLDMQGLYKCTNRFKRPRCLLPVHLSHRAGLKSGLDLYENHEQGAVGDFGAVEQFRTFWIALRDYV